MSTKARAKLFRRILIEYVAATIVVLGVVVAVAWEDLPTMDVRLVIVGFAYWLLPIPCIHILLNWRQLWKKALLAVVSTTIVTVAVLELIGWLIFPDRQELTLIQAGYASPRYHHVLPPNRRIVQTQHPPYRIHIETNEDGFRTPHERDEFAEYDRRIVMLGDSFVFGFLLPEEDTIPRQLEGLIQAAFPAQSVGVLNTGIVSYSPMLERQVVLGKAGFYRPQITVLCLDVTDIGDDFKYADENQGTPDNPRFDFPVEWTLPPPARGRGPMTLHVLRKTRLTFPIECLFSSFPEPRGEGAVHYKYFDFKVEVGGVVERNRFFILRHPLQETRRHFERTFQHIQAVHAACEQLGSHFLLVLLPRHFHWNTKEAPENWEQKLGQYTNDEPHKNVFFEFFESRCAEEHIPVLNLQPVFASSNAFPLCLRDDPHYNSAGARVAADGIFKRLRNERWLR
jgi:hypothetical protein